MAEAGSGVFESLTRRHGVKVASAVSIEVCCLAAGEVVGFESILSAARMNSAIVIFLSSVEKANELVERGLVINDVFTAMLPLSMPSKRVILSNVPPFVKDDFLVGMLSRYGKLVSPITKMQLGNVSPLLKHVVSFRRYAYMVVKDNVELDVSFNFRMDDFDYMIYATTDKMKCFGCGKTGHMVRICPDKDKNVEGEEEVRPRTPAEEAGEASISNFQPGVTKEGDGRLTVETAVDIMKDTPSISQVGDRAALAEGEMQGSSVEGGVKPSQSSQSFKAPLKWKKMKDDSFVKVA